MIIETIKYQTREELFIHLYESTFPKVAGFIRKMGGNLEEAKDIFQDALVIYYEKQHDPSFKIDSSESSYLMGISRHLWFQKHLEKQQTQKTDWSNIKIPDEQEPVVSESILKYVEQSGKKCLELLKAFYYDKMSMKELSFKFGFSGERSATVQKYKCLEKVRTTIKEQSLSKGDFYD